MFSSSALWDVFYAFNVNGGQPSFPIVVVKIRVTAAVLGRTWEIADRVSNGPTLDTAPPLGEPEDRSADSQRSPIRNARLLCCGTPKSAASSKLYVDDIAKPGRPLGELVKKDFAVFSQQSADVLHEEEVGAHILDHPNELQDEFIPYVSSRSTTL